jgi:hypothetical protein
MTTRAVDLEGLEDRLSRVICTSNWTKLQSAFDSSEAIYIVGNGGNLAIADHAALDIQRITGKSATAPASGVISTSLVSERGADRWIAAWLEAVAGSRLRSDTAARVLTIGLSCSAEGTSSDAICGALQTCNMAGGEAFLLTAREKRNLQAGVLQIVTDTNTYHATEVLTLTLMYQLIFGSGALMERIGVHLPGSSTAS